MNKPELEDFGLNPKLTLEIIDYSKKQRRQYWLIVNLLTLLVIVAIPVFIPTTFNNKLVIMGGLFIILYVLNYNTAFKLLLRIFFKPHPLLPKLNEYNKAVLHYQNSSKSEIP